MVVIKYLNKSKLTLKYAFLQQVHIINPYPPLNQINNNAQVSTFFKPSVSLSAMHGGICCRVCDYGLYSTFGNALWDALHELHSSTVTFAINPVSDEDTIS